MQRHRPENLSLPSVRSILDESPFPVGATAAMRRPNDSWSNPTSTHAPLPFSHSNITTSIGNRIDSQPDPMTPQRHRSVPVMYPSPASEDSYDVLETDEGSGWREAAARPLFKVEETASQNGDADTVATTELKHCVESKPGDVLTPTMVHYRPHGIPSARSSKLSPSDQKKGNRRSSKGDSQENKGKLVKWDRVSDKGNAPLNVAPRPTGPRSCTLCYITKRKVLSQIKVHSNIQCDRTDGARPNETHPCQACQKGNFVCQFISPSQLREGTTQPPTLESLKLHCEQAQRLRTQDLEEKVVKLEHALEMATMENRVQSGYIANLKVYEQNVLIYVWRLRERLEELDPGCRLLQEFVPPMPVRRKRERSLEGDPNTKQELPPLSEVVESNS